MSIVSFLLENQPKDFVISFYAYFNRFIRIYCATIILFLFRSKKFDVRYEALEQNNNQLEEENYYLEERYL